MVITDRIKNEYPNYNKTRRKLADFMLSHTERCSMLSLKDIAELSGVTQVTVLSFCRDLGYQNYAAFRQELRGEMISRVDLQGRLRLARAGCASDAALCDELVRFAHQMIDVTCANNGKEKIERFAKRIADAKRVFVAGHDVTGAVARALTSRLIYLGVDARFLDMERQDEMFSLLTSHPPEECLLVAYGFHPVGKPMLSIAEFCAKLKMDIVCITDAPTSPLTPFSSLSLMCCVRLMNLFNTSFPVYFMNDILTTFLFLELDARQGGVEKDNSALRALFPDYFALV